MLFFVTKNQGDKNINMINKLKASNVFRKTEIKSLI